MKIDNNGLLINLKAYKNTFKAQTKADNSTIRQTHSTTKDDRVHLSVEAKQVQDCEKLLPSVPDIREDKVAKIKSDIENGTYQIDIKKIGDKILTDLLVNS